ncbi:hypothetical protein BS1321_01700 [Peribacillus simplex NBRC 15720 = DSM 1321]|uniref:Uncharacterized protein n=1 Tax=Peribacillus simplex NBRC 15720 = DSM 1321 TaxID=1349754 RepID=A0A223EC67_9BACI|nr:hypothetical protein BS1321_01700 [Peribacillus simplex NBRC 15720 = DSM 1321]
MFVKFELTNLSKTVKINNKKKNMMGLKCTIEVFFINIEEKEKGPPLLMLKYDFSSFHSIFV